MSQPTEINVINNLPATTSEENTMRVAAMTSELVLPRKLQTVSETFGIVSYDFGYDLADVGELLGARAAGSPGHARLRKTSISGFLFCIAVQASAKISFYAF